MWIIIYNGNDAKNDARSTGDNCLQCGWRAWRLLPQALQRTRPTFTDALVLYRVRRLRFDRVRMGFRDATPETGHHQRCLLHFDGTAVDCRWGGALRRIAQPL